MNIPDDLAALIRATHLKITQTVPQDASLEESVLWNTVNQLKSGIELERVLHSDATLLSIAWLLHYLAIQGVVDLENIREIRLTPSFAGKMTLGSYRSLHFLDDRPARDDAFELYAQIVSESPYYGNPQSFRQSPNTLSSAVRRHNIMRKYGDLSDKSILILGDNSLYSIYCGLSGETGNIQVIDIDGGLCNYIAQVAERYKLPIKVFKSDLLLDGVPDQLIEKIDCSICTGLKDLGGLMSFLAYGVKALRIPETCPGVCYVAFDITVTGRAFNGEACRLGLIKKLIEYGCYVDCLVPCDEIILNDKLVKCIHHILIDANQAKEAYSISSFREQLITLVEREGIKDTLLDQPEFPAFAVGPIDLCRVRVPTEAKKIFRRLAAMSRSYRLKSM